MRTHALPIPLTRRLLRCLARVGLALVWATLVGRPAAYAQTFNSGSTGADGALTLTTPGTVLFDPRTFQPPLDPEGDNIYHFTTITVASGVTVRLSATRLNGPVFWLASGPVQIDRVIDLNGQPGQKVTDYTTSALRLPSEPGAGGYPGGIGRLSSLPGEPGHGPGAGGSGSSGTTGGGAGHAASGSGSFAGVPYGNNFLVPLIGGSGGGGGNNGAGGAGGAGGGALLLASSASITINGTIRADGGPNSFGNGGGGGGSGGALHVLAPVINGTGMLTALGTSTSAGNGGSPGRIRMEAFQFGFSGTTNPGRILTMPFAVFLPAIPPPSLRVVSIAGITVASDPLGNFTVPDVTISAATAVPVAIEARNIPPGTIVKLHLFSDNGANQILDSPPLAGTLALATATTSAILPLGFSRGFVHATWTP